MNAIKNLSLLFILSLFSFGCTSCSTIDPNADPVVVDVERTLNVAFDVMDSFLMYEDLHHDRLLALNSDVAVFANVVRAQGRSWLDAANTAKNLYKASKTPENKQKLMESIAVLRTKLLEIETQFTAAKEKVENK